MRNRNALRIDRGTGSDSLTIVGSACEVLRVLPCVRAAGVTQVPMSMRLLFGNNCYSDQQCDEGQVKHHRCVLVTRTKTHRVPYTLHVARDRSIVCSVPEHPPRRNNSKQQRLGDAQRVPRDIGPTNQQKVDILRTSPVTAFIYLPCSAL